MNNNKTSETAIDPFLQRAVEHWLDSANELGYQPLFCQWLTTKGYTVKYSIKNTSFEQGKDVVAVDGDGVPHAYQLKGGGINLNRWRTEVKPEIEALIDCPIEHPEISKDKNHISYLVTNGEIDDSVRVEIVSLNEKKWKSTPLHVLTRGDLLSGFQQIADGILPKDAHTYKVLMDLIFEDGTAFPDMGRVNSFLSEILKLNDPLDAKIAKEQRKRDISAAILYCNMIIGSYRNNRNYASVVRVLVLLLSLIFYLVDKYSLNDQYWIESYKIIWNDILASAIFLEEEVNSNGFNSSFITPFDVDLIPYRKHSAISIIYPLKLSQFLMGDSEWKKILEPEIISKYGGTIALWGEASFVPSIMLFLILKNFDEAKALANKTLEYSIQKIIDFNGKNSKDEIGLIPPYYDMDFAIKRNMGMLEDEFDDNYKLSSYILKPLLEMAVRFGEKKFISEKWRDISFIHLEEFIPDNYIDQYLWRSEKGENLTIVLKKEKSWAELEKEAVSLTHSDIPPTMKRFVEFLPFFISVFPFRANSLILGLLYDSTSHVKQ